AALQRSPAVQSARTGAQVARAQQMSARSRLLPSLGASGSYTRNERAVTVPLGGAATAQQGLASEAPPVVITPLNQLDLNLSLDVPLFDGAAFARGAAADSGVEAADAQLRADLQSTLLAVAVAYHEAIAARRVVEAAERSLEAARASESRLAARAAAGAATTLAHLRAQAEVGRARQALAEAAAARAAAERQLASLTGETAPPSAGASTPRLEGLEGATAAPRPELAAARAALAQAQAQRAAAAWAYAPSLAARATERVTNAAGFAGAPATWTVGATLSWRLFDSFGREAAIDEAGARVTQARARVDQLLRETGDAVENARDRLAAAREKLAAAREERTAADEAARIARKQLEEGASMPADVALAERDAFSAAVNEIRAGADLAIAVERLRHAAGLSMLEGA
ncbi:MAG TPA: TolC family protein, partial [Myxococcales bacterium]|nr:TolC family protein [Myxococcales bacterium]